MGEVVFVGLTVVGALFSLLLWLGTAVKVRSALSREESLHFVTVYLAILTFVLFDAIILLGFVHLLSALTFRLMISFTMGIQVVDAMAAFLFVRSVKRRQKVQ